MTTTDKLSLAAFLKRRETKPYSEYCDGEVTRKSMPSIAHSMIQHLLSFVFGIYLREHALGIAGPEIRCIMFRGTARWAPVPDFVFISYERLGSGSIFASIQGPPDLAVEILSPDDSVTDAIAKVRDYLANGVRLAWLFDPKQRTVRVVTAPDYMHTLSENDMLEGSDVLPGFRVPVRDVLPSMERGLRTE